jgi:hypothetical protein
LLGEEPLAARCGDHLLGRGHVILGVVAASPAIAQWAKARGVRLIERGAYPSWLAEQSFDLLLSVTHPNLIDPCQIARARVAAVNYHDGPLPRYAGMNGSAWGTGLRGTAARHRLAPAHRWAG